MNLEAIKELLYHLGDDELIMGHRHSEWCGLGPILEEDISFASMAQDEMGHAQAYYMLLQDLGEGTPDQIGFGRTADQFFNSQFVELPNGEYEFSLVRQFLYDVAEHVRLDDLKNSAYEPLKALATRLVREEKYHFMHGITWLARLSSATEEAKFRIQHALNQAFPIAFSMFEPTEAMKQRVQDSVQSHESVLQSKWLALVTELLSDTVLKLPEINTFDSFYGGRMKKHSAHLAPLLDEMTVVIRTDPQTHW